MSQPTINDSASGAAATSLWAAMGDGRSAPQEAPIAATASSASTEDDIFEAPSAVDVPSSTSDPWRLKFLVRMGIEGAAQVGPGSEEVGLGPPLPDSPVSSGVDRVDSVESDIDSTETVVVRTVAPPRTNDSIRAGYIRKLEASKASMPQLNRPKQAQVVTIFDWDDTLLCTTHLEMVFTPPLPRPNHLAGGGARSAHADPMLCTRACRRCNGSMEPSRCTCATSWDSWKRWCTRFCCRRWRQARSSLLPTPPRGGCSIRRACACRG